MMNRKIAATALAASLLATPAAAVAAPGPNSDCTGTPVGSGPGNGPGPQTGAGPNRAIPAGTLTKAQAAALAAMAEEEKLAHDVYVAFGKKYDDPRFAGIAQAESRHLAALQRLMSRYGVADLTQGLDEGEFKSEAVTTLYKKLVKRGTTLPKALKVGATIERMDIKDLRNARSEVGQADIKRVYTNLLRGSRNHLAAFTR
jgi:hypothetical protein